ncbi:hypothetical protein N7510_004715 [Penicillium lagena]|uniref:uncharacterized protein n=1 Tax=Penicillium lagena TaxID=94218 RepID=UPI00254202C6|nr:uncharacterized protein N7510_004715 [Penicillium lagena]KAJ5620731.1 hypothetical protein N7510_004715 [Penicillium lagena]
MTSISLPFQSQPTGFAQHFDSPDQPIADPSRHLTMPATLPNPPFVFPARDADVSDNQSETPGPRTPPQLPAFSFNPGAGPSPQPTQPYNPRLSAHRRRPSEFVGGEQLVTPESVDDKKEDPAASSTLPPPGPPGPGRGPGRRGHAHRRSAAISGVDLNAISKALGTNPAAPSAPVTPSERGFDDISRPLSYSASSLGRLSPPGSPGIPPVPPLPSAICVEPAPDDTPNTDGTVSILSNETPTNTAAINPPQPHNPARDGTLSFADGGPTPRDRKPKPRPKTADASLAFDLIQSSKSSGVSSVKRSKSSGHSRSRKSMSRGLLDAALSSHSAEDARSTDTSRRSFSNDDGSDTSSDSEHDSGFLSAKKPSSKSKKKKRVRSWAGAILTRGKSKGKRGAKLNLACKAPTPSPPALSRTNSDIGSVDFDDDHIVVLRTPTNPVAPVSEAERSRDSLPVPLPSLETAWKPRSFYEQGRQDDTVSSPIIDLDAALGPFNTPTIQPAVGAASNFTLATQRMYSGGRRGEFIGPEMRYHRRAESAPTLPPFDRSALVASSRLSVAPVLENADVFDEEEEDAFLAENIQSPKPDAPPAQNSVTMSDDEKTSVKSDNSSNSLTRPTATSDAPQHTGLGLQEDQSAIPNAPTEPEKPMQDVGNVFLDPPQNSVEIIKSEEGGDRAPGPSSPDVSPRFLAVEKRPASSPMEFMPTIPPFALSAGVSPSDSSFPSPGAPRTPFDRTFSSHSYHHLPSEFPHASVEDVPSLTSSASTMTNTMHRFSATFLARARPSTDRAASFSVGLNRRTDPANSPKRSSLASLSKLMSGPSERSKLSQEEKPPGDSPDKTTRKGRRISRLMHFWKQKDKDKFSAETASAPRPRARPTS